MTRHTPAELLEISTKELLRKRLAVVEEKQQGRKLANQMKQIKLEQDAVWRRVLSAAISMHTELNIDNPTKAQLDFLASKGIEYCALYLRTNSYPKMRLKLDALRKKSEQLENQINQTTDEFHKELYKLTDHINAWVEKNTEVAYQASLEPWFSEDLISYWEFDQKTALGLQNHLTDQIDSSWQKIKVNRLKILKKLIDKQLSLQEKHLSKITKLSHDLALLRSKIDQLEGDDDLRNGEGINAIYWVSWNNAERLKYWSADPDISLLNWITTYPGQTYLKSIDKALLRKASNGEREAVFRIGEKAPYQTSAEMDDKTSYRYSCDGEWVSAYGPNADVFSLLMELMGYRVKIKTMPDKVCQATVSWGG